MRAVRTLMGRVGSWWRLDLGEKVEVVAIVGLALLAEIAVKVVSLPRLAAALGVALANHDRGPDEPTAATRSRMGRETIEKRARAVDRVYRHWPRKRSCLRRALVLGYRIRDAEPTLWFGVARENGEIRAHAWIEVQGEVVGSESGDWAPLRPHENAG